MNIVKHFRHCPAYLVFKARLDASDTNEVAALIDISFNQHFYVNWGNEGFFDQIIIPPGHSKLKMRSWRE